MGLWAGARGRHTADGVKRMALSGALVMTALLVASPLTAQRATASTVSVRIPPVSQLEVEPLGSAGGEQEIFRIRIRANHAWTLVVRAPADLDPGIWVRVTGEGRPGFRPLAGGATALADGERGETVVEVAYRREDGGTVASLPLVYTLTPVD